MIDFLILMACALIRLVRSRARLEAEILVLRQQINVLRRKSPKRPSFSNFDRLLFVWLSRLVPTTLEALTVVRPETVIGWHRAGFRAYWRWKSRPCGGRPKKPLQIRQLIRDMSIANPLWGAPRIHGELLKLGIVLGKPQLPSTWRGDDDCRPKAGGRFCTITRMASHRWIYSWFRRSRSVCCMDL